MPNATRAAHSARDSTAFRVAARSGFVVLGLIHVLIGGIAVAFATGSGGGEADNSGALRMVRDAPVGIVLLWGIAVGLTALAVWQVLEAFLERQSDTKKRWVLRAKYIGTAVAYLAIAGTAVTTALGSSSSSSGPATLSGTLLGNPAGVVALIVVGLGVLAVGVAFVARGITRSFKDNLTLPGGTVGKAVVVLGAVGYSAKGIAVAVIGVLFVVAAVTHDPETAGGLDAALHSLAGLPFGTVILWIVGVGLILYGLYCGARARYATM